MMMISKYKSIDQLWEEKVTGIDNFKGNYATSRGQEMEGIARDIYEFEFKVTMTPMVFVHPRFSFMRYSSDGYNDELKYNVEFKCPMSPAVVIEALSGKVPDLYMPQLMWAMLVSDTSFIHYCTFDGKSTLAVTRVDRNEEYIKAMLIRARWFWRKVLTKSEITKEEKQKCLSLNKKLFTALATKPVPIRSLNNE
jgi:putative phage-type endonuclease